MSPSDKKSVCWVSVTQVTIKAHGPLVYLKGTDNKIVKIHLKIFFRITRPFQPNLKKSILGWRGFKFVHIERPSLFPKGDNKHNCKNTFKKFKIFSSRTTGQILILKSSPDLLDQFYDLPLTLTINGMQGIKGLGLFLQNLTICLIIVWRKLYTTD